MTALKSRVEKLIAENTAVNDRLKQVEERLEVSIHAQDEGQRALRLELGSAVARIDSLDFPELRAWEKDGVLNASSLRLNIAGAEESMIALPGQLNFFKSNNRLGTLTGSSLELGGAEFASIELNSTASTRKVDINSGPVAARIAINDEQRTLQLALAPEFAGVIVNSNVIANGVISLGLTNVGTTVLSMVQDGSSAGMSTSADGAKAIVYSATGDFGAGLHADKSESKVFANSKVSSGKEDGSVASIGVLLLEKGPEPYGRFENKDSKSQTWLSSDSISLERNSRTLTLLTLAKRGGRIDIYDEVGDESRIVLGLDRESGSPVVLVNSGSKAGILSPTIELK